MKRWHEHDRGLDVELMLDGPGDDGLVIDIILSVHNDSRRMLVDFHGRDACYGIGTAARWSYASTLRAYRRAQEGAIKKLERMLRLIREQKPPTQAQIERLIKARSR